MPLFELIFVTHGKLHIEQFHQQTEIGPAQTILLWPDRPHRGWKVNPLDLVYFWTYFSHLSPVESAPLVVSLPSLMTVARPDHLAALFHRLIDDLEANIQGSYAADLTLMAVLHEAGLQLSTAEAVEPGGLLARRADAIIRRSFHLPIHPSTIADQLGCSPDYLGRLYRNTYRVSLTDAIHHRRVQHACHLLMLGELPIEEIARQCGFSESGYFRRVFRRLEGMTPRHYQTLHAHGEGTPRSSA